MKNFLASLLMVFGLSMPAMAASTADLQKMEDQVFSPTVRLGAFCSGSIVSSERHKETGDVATYILTAKHCTEKAGQRIPIEIEYHNKKMHLTKTESFEGFVISQHYRSDLALVRLVDDNTLFPNTAKIAPKGYEYSLNFGQDVWVVGHPLGKSMTLTEGALGFVENDPGFNIGKFFYRATPDIAPGSSGGAMYTKNGDGDFVLIGVVTGGARGITFFNYFTPLENINDYLEGWFE